MNSQELLNQLQHSLIVSCQALEDEPLHSSFIMSKMALAAKLGGAAGIRANTVEDIQAIKLEVNLPIIGIIKKDYPNEAVFITPTITEISALAEEGVDIIALDGTDRMRPGHLTFKELLSQAKQKYPEQLFMADVSTLEEGVLAAEAGADIVAPTLAGYTPYSHGVKPLELVKQLVEKVNVPVIAEGNFDTPEKAKQAIELGAHAVVVGSAITRPMTITEKFATAIHHN
ncbi:N-acetylmannosamine-6-phosphate 2-epimerase [Sporosarcina jeotgali]|uniref:Putative N-acetylmannosamine-6-phosphate 2-epimerase n=1 Tax=Sporosarcina jeotgali TaxID=3020056 RepID=A0ABZ0KTR6_9BACL|nr:N-acetylmannosamine-6-phosphate 2-epimerase [Sporosarcina sp. B2O-1]WOV83830.1 N-acetylmannosamine-6-phosphate 2-epimerase [Sporosarcina sp. B2O-1]